MQNPATGTQAKSKTCTELVECIQNPNTVLVIDDDPAVHDLLTNYLAKEGFRVKTASTTEEGLRLAKVEQPDVITLDVLMPDPCMDGWAALAALKADPTLADIPVVMVTIVDDKNKGFALGAADYLTKPIDRERLITIVKKYRREPISPSGSDTLPPPLTKQPALEVGETGDVLVVEDDPAIREMLRYVLEQEGVRVAETDNGRAALAQIAVRRPGLILLDLMLPEMDGFEFLAVLRQNPAWQSIPVVVVTAMNLTLEERQRLNGSIEKLIQKGTDEAALSTSSLPVFPLQGGTDGSGVAAAPQAGLLRQIRDVVRAHRLERSKAL